MDQGRLKTALDGFRRYGGPEAKRAADHLEVAFAHSLQRSRRWTEQMCYSLREALESVPPLFGQEPMRTSPSDQARALLGEIGAVLAVQHPPNVFQEIVANLSQRLDAGQTERRSRVVGAMLAQAGVAVSSPQVDAFAQEWLEVVERVNGILHGTDHDETEALTLRDRALDLMTALVGPISSRLDEVDRLAQVSTPSGENIRRVVHLVADDRLARHFFSTCESIAWLRAMEREGFFQIPMVGNWYQGDFLIRLGPQDPGLAKTIAGRIAREPHAAAAAVVLNLAAGLDSDATELAEAALSVPSFQDAFRVAHALETLIERWADDGQTSTLGRLADMILEPQREAGSHRLRGKLEPYNFGRIVRLLVTRCQCEDLPALARVLRFKLRRVIEMQGGHAMIVSIGRELISNGDGYERDLDDALVSGLRDVLGRMRECGSSLQARKEILEPIDDEIIVRIWADQLVEEERRAS